MSRAELCAVNTIDRKEALALLGAAVAALDAGRPIHDAAASYIAESLGRVLDGVDAAAAFGVARPKARPKKNEAPDRSVPAPDIGALENPAGDPPYLAVRRLVMLARGDIDRGRPVRPAASVFLRAALAYLIAGADAKKAFPVRQPRGGRYKDERDVMIAIDHYRWLARGWSKAKVVRHVCRVWFPRQEKDYKEIVRIAERWEQHARSYLTDFSEVRESDRKWGDLPGQHRHFPELARSHARRRMAHRPRRKSSI